jgi:hypothetical protein
MERVHFLFCRSEEFERVSDLLSGGESWVGVPGGGKLFLVTLADGGFELDGGGGGTWEGWYGLVETQPHHLGVEHGQKRDVIAEACREDGGGDTAISMLRLHDDVVNPAATPLVCMRVWAWWWCRICRAELVPGQEAAVPVI